LHYIYIVIYPILSCNKCGNKMEGRMTPVNKTAPTMKRKTRAGDF